MGLLCVLTLCPHRRRVSGMAKSVVIKQRWPQVLASRMKLLARERHTTVSELTRQAIVDRYALTEDAREVMP